MAPCRPVWFPSTHSKENQHNSLLSSLSITSMTTNRLVYFLVSLACAYLPLGESYCPVVICPGFGNDQIDYEEPLKQPREVGLRSVLARRGFDLEQIYTVPIQRSDWIRVAGGLLDIPDFYTGTAKPTGLGYGWYIQKLKETVDLAYEQSGGQKVLLLAHSAGGWLARAAMADGTWSTAGAATTTTEDEQDDTLLLQTSDRIRCLATMGAIHKEPTDASTCVTRGALKTTNDQYPGAFLKETGIGYVSIGGAAIVGDNTKEQAEPTDDVNKLYATRGEGSASRVAFTSYEAVCGMGGVIGDGVVPFDWSQLEGSRQLKLDGVLHSINEAGTTFPTDRWYGSEAIVDSWLPVVLEEAGLSKSGTAASSPLAGIQEWASGFLKTAEDSSRRSLLRLVPVGLATGTLLSQPPNKANAMYENAPPVTQNSKPIVLPSGVSIQDLRLGDGDLVSEGKRVNIQWVLKRSNGYSIDSSANNDGVPFIFVVGAKDGARRAITGLDEGIRGLRVGGIRRIVIPPSLAYVEGLENGKPGPIPPDFGPKQRIQRVMNMLKDDIPGESFMLDIKATRVQ